MNSLTRSVLPARWPALAALVLLAGSAMCTGCMTNHDTPDDVDYRILLGTWRGQEHAARAGHVKEVVEQQAGWKEISLISRYQETVLYWGHYKSPKDAQEDLNKARAFKSPDLGNNYLFTQARVEDVGQDVGPTQWNLAHVDPMYMYTVVVAVFHDEPDLHYMGRRRIAVEACKEFRDKGEDAYFYHDRIKSIVTVGLFRVNAVRPRMVTVPGGGGMVEEKVPSREVQAVLGKYQTLQDNGAPLKMVVASKGKPNIEQQLREKGVPESKIPGYLQAMHLDLGSEGQRVGKLNEFYAPSYLIEIPKRPSVQDPFAGLGNP